MMLIMLHRLTRGQAFLAQVIVDSRVIFEQSDLLSAQKAVAIVMVITESDFQCCADPGKAVEHLLR